MGQNLNITAHEDPAAKIQQNYCNPWTMLKRIRFYVSPKIHYVEWKDICNLLYLKNLHIVLVLSTLMYQDLQNSSNPCMREGKYTEKKN